MNFKLQMYGVSRFGELVKLLLLVCFAVGLLTSGSILYSQDELPTEESELILPSDNHTLSSESPNKPGAENVSGKLVWVYVLLGVTGVLAWAFVKRGKASIFGKKFQGSSSIQITETKSLGNRQYIMVAEVSGERVLLSGGPNGVQHLCKLKDSSELAFPDIEGPNLDHVTEETGEGA